MAGLQKDPSGNWHISFRFSGRKFKRTLATKNRREADAAVVRVEENMEMVKRGRLEMPAGADVPSFLLSDGKMPQRRPSPEALATPTVLTIGDLFREYFAMLPEGNLEPDTIKCLRIHERHALRVFGASFPCAGLNATAIQSYIEKRSRERHRGRTAGALTIKKEVATLRSICNWGVQHAIPVSKITIRGLRYPKSREKPPFQTMEEVARQLAKGVSDQEAKALQDASYLTVAEISELLELVRERAQQRFIYPMFVFCAHTGCRRSEMLRAKIADVDFEAGIITVHERKKSHGKTTTRQAPLTGPLREALTNWLSNHPGGPHLFCKARLSRSRVRSRVNGPLTRNEAHDHFHRATAGTKWEMLKGWHVLRHSYISGLAARGVDQRIIDACVGHTTEDMRRRYRHLVPSVTQEAIRGVFG